jgi:ABC-type enterochelin transport system permease subunit
LLCLYVNDLRQSAKSVMLAKCGFYVLCDVMSRCFYSFFLYPFPPGLVHGMW